MRLFEEADMGFPFEATVYRKDGSTDSCWIDLDRSQVSISTKAMARYSGLKDPITQRQINNVRAYIISEETARYILTELIKNHIHGGLVQFRNPSVLYFGVGSRDDRANVEDYPNWLSRNMGLVRDLKAKYDQAQ